MEGTAFTVVQKGSYLISVLLATFISRDEYDDTFSDFV